MLEKDRRSTVRRSNDRPAEESPAPPAPTTLWRMRSATRDNQASCSVTVTEDGCDVLITFAKGLGVPEHFADPAAAMRHSMEIAGRLIAQGWVELEAPDE